MPVCGPNEVLVPQHCRVKTQRSGANDSVRRSERRDIKAFLDDEIYTPVIPPLSSYPLEERAIRATITKFLDVMNRTPGFVVDVVEGMRDYRKRIPDVEKRYRHVTKRLAKDAFLRNSLEVKHAVLRILLRNG